MPYQYGHVYVLVSFMYVLSTLAVVHQFDEPMKTQCVCVFGGGLYYRYMYTVTRPRSNEGIFLELRSHARTCN